MSDTTKKKIILGSASPRRRELLAQIGADFEVRVSGKEEIYHSTVPEEIVKELALMKAENVAAEVAESGAAAGREDQESARAAKIKDTVIIGADTIVVLDGEILGKPADEADAARMLERLQGRRHDVYTGVAVLGYDENGEKRVFNYSVGTAVYVNRMTEEEIRSYVETKDPPRQSRRLRHPGTVRGAYRPDRRGLLQCGRTAGVKGVPDAEGTGVLNHVPEGLPLVAQPFSRLLIIRKHRFHDRVEGF